MSFQSIFGKQTATGAKKNSSSGERAGVRRDDVHDDCYERLAMASFAREKKKKIEAEKEKA